MEMYEAIIDEGQIESGIQAISLVESPAIESNFVKLSKEVTFAAVEEKRLLVGAILIPNKPIYRRDTEEYYMFFSKDTVRRASELYFINGNQSKATLEHELKLQGLTLVESWIVEDSEKDKSKFYGLNVPIGTWMGSMKVEDKKVWEDVVREGSMKGFSIEGYFTPRKTEMKKKLTPDEVVESIKKLIHEG